jgi:hypothetical protein
MLAAFHRKYPTLIRRLAAVTVPALLAAPLLVSLPGAAAVGPARWVSELIPGPCPASTG